MNLKIEELNHTLEALLLAVTRLDEIEQSEDSATIHRLVVKCVEAAKSLSSPQ